jgi:LytS/YehU family sensor histidine kinase
MLNKNPRNSTKIEKLLPYILAFLLPGIAFVSNRSFYENFKLLELIPAWLMIAIFLLVLWYVNDWLSYRNISYKYLIIAITNLLTASVFVIIISLLLPDLVDTANVFSWFISFRILLASIIFITIQQSLKAVKSVETLKAENLSLKTENYKAELDQLRKQVNPHFLFNSLSTLRTMIRKSDPNSEDFLINLSSFYRQMLQTHNRDFVSLEEEIKFLDAYFYLMKARHEDALKIKIEINPKSYQYSIPFFALQILVENCIKHNIVSVDKPLSINIYQKDTVSITVENNYQPKEQNIDSQGVGLINLLARYKLLGIENGLEIDKTDNHFIVSLKLF